MADDEKILALIAEAEAFTPLSVLGKPIARELDMAILLIHQLADALEATLPGDDDWEYGRDTGPYGIDWVDRDRADVAEAVAEWRGSLLVRRRPAGPWEPVEEVPRGEG